jgi:ribose transport system ATP-binding protein
VTDKTQTTLAENLSDNSKPILEMCNITKAFPGVVALDDVTFECQPGEVHALVGENGAGKSTLMKILSGAYQPDRGTVSLKGKKITFKHPQQAQNAGISIIYQEFNLLPDRTVGQNIYLGREPMRGIFVDSKLISDLTGELLESLGVKIDPLAPVGLLGVAQQQAVEIAKALSLDADIIVMDEPTAPLSLHEVDNLLALVKRLKEHGITIIYITHRLEEVFEIADRVTVLKDGKMVGCAPVGKYDPDKLVHQMVGREFDHYFPHKASLDQIGETILEVNDLHTGKELCDISFTIKKGEVVGFAGLEGSGRTKLARVLFGADRYDKGEVKLNGSKVRFRSPVDAIRSGFGFISEDRKKEGLVLSMSLKPNVALPSLGARQVLGFIKRRQEQRLVEELAQAIDIRSASEGQEVQFLSGGNQQKVVLAKWLGTKAKVLLFDEPTRGIDVGAKASIHQLMRDLASQGVAVMMISSELPEIIGMSDRVIVMREGRIQAELEGDQLTEKTIMHAATGTSDENSGSGEIQ